MAKWNPFVKRSHPPEAGEKEDSHVPPAQGPVGRLLRQVREEKGLSLDKVEAQTRIRQKYLLALEEARYEDMPTSGHIHGFLRNYALYLGLDLKEVEALYLQDRAARRHLEPKIFYPKNIMLLPKKPLLKADLMLSIVFVLILTAVGWLFWRYGLPVVWPLVASSAPTSTPTPAALVEPSATRVRPTATATAVPVSETATLVPVPSATPTLDMPLPLATPTPRPTTTPTPTITPTPVSGVLVKLKATDLVWLQVTVDGQLLPGEFLEAGQEKEWQGQRSVYMICGNAGGVDITVNGQQVGALGGRAEVIEKTWGPEGEVTPTPPAETRLPPTQAPVG